jgi:hypothetical protein
MATTSLSDSERAALVARIVALGHELESFLDEASSPEAAAAACRRLAEMIRLQSELAASDQA